MPFKVLVATLVLCLAGCAASPKPLSETDRLSYGLWELTTQDDALTLEQVAQALHIQLSDYEDNTWAYRHLGWTNVLSRKSPETKPVLSISLAKTRGQADGQTLWVTFDSSTCLSLEDIGRLVGQDVVQSYMQGYADVRGAWLTFLEWEGQIVSNELGAPLGCSRNFKIYKTFRGKLTGT